ncbi:MAG: hypothetical protein RR646_03335 [Erysipelotrichaceae bacterium]
MVDIRMLEFDNISYVGILVKIAHNPIYIITNTRLILTTSYFNESSFNNINVIIVDKANSYNSLYSSIVIASNDSNLIGMKAYDALKIINQEKI